MSIFAHYQNCEKGKNQTAQTALHYVRGSSQPASQPGKSHLTMWLRSEPPLRHGDQRSRSSNNSSENTFLQITRWSAALYQAQGSAPLPGSLARVGSFGSLAEERPRVTVPPPLPAHHVTRVLPQSLSIDCQVQDVVFTSVLI